MASLFSIRIFEVFDSVLLVQFWFLIHALLILIAFSFLLWRKKMIKSVFVVSSFIFISFIYLNNPELNGYSVDETGEDRFTESNYPTIQPNDIIISKHFNFSLQLGVMVAVKVDDNLLRKRIHAMPGDQVHICNSEVYVNGMRYMYSNNWVGELIDDRQKCIKRNSVFFLLNDEYFVIGDNEKNSYDSRSFGPVKKADIIAQSLYVVRFNDYNQQVIPLAVTFSKSLIK